MTIDSPPPTGGRAPENQPPSRPPSLAAFAVQCLLREGLRTVTHVPGGPVMRLVTELHHAAHQGLRLVFARTEAGACLMAEGHFRATGRLAGCVTTAGPAPLNAQMALALALRELSGLVLISAQVSSRLLGRNAAQEFDVVSATRAVTKESLELTEPQQIVDELPRLIALARSDRPGPVHLSIPADFFAAPIVEHRREVVQEGAPRELAALDSGAVRTLDRWLKEASRPVVIAGYGTLLSEATAALLLLADCYPSIRVATTPRAKGVFPESHRASLSSIGFASPNPRSLEQADLLLVLGSRLGELSTGGFKPLPRARLVRVDIEPSVLGQDSQALSILGDIRQVLCALCTFRTEAA